MFRNDSYIPENVGYGEDIVDQGEVRANTPLLTNKPWIKAGEGEELRYIDTGLTNADRNDERYGIPSIDKMKSGEGFAVGTKGMQAIKPFENKDAGNPDAESRGGYSVINSSVTPPATNQAKRDPTPEDIFGMVEQKTGWIFGQNAYDIANQRLDAELPQAFRNVFGKSISEIGSLSKDQQKYWLGLVDTNRNKYLKEADYKSTEAWNYLKIAFNMYDKKQKDELAILRAKETERKDRATESRNLTKDAAMEKRDIARDKATEENRQEIKEFKEDKKAEDKKRSFIYELERKMKRYEDEIKQTEKKLAGLEGSRDKNVKEQRGIYEKHISDLEKAKAQTEETRQAVSRGIFTPEQITYKDTSPAPVTSPTVVPATPAPVTPAPPATQGGQKVKIISPFQLDDITTQLKKAYEKDGIKLHKGHVDEWLKKNGYVRG